MCRTQQQNYIQRRPHVLPRKKLWRTDGRKDGRTQDVLLLSRGKESIRRGSLDACCLIGGRRQILGLRHGQPSDRTQHGYQHSYHSFTQHTDRTQHGYQYSYHAFTQHVSCYLNPQHPFVSTDTNIYGEVLSLGRAISIRDARTGNDFEQCEISRSYSRSGEDYDLHGYDCRYDSDDGTCCLHSGRP
jgi:hypothetical protein